MELRFLFRGTNLGVIHRRNFRRAAALLPCDKEARGVENKGLTCHEPETHKDEKFPISRKAMFYSTNEISIRIHVRIFLKLSSKMEPWNPSDPKTRFFPSSLTRAH